MQRIQMQAAKTKTTTTASLNGLMGIGMMWTQQAYEEQHIACKQS